MTQPLSADDSAPVGAGAFPAHVGASPVQAPAYVVHPDPNAVPYSIGTAFTWALRKFSANATGLVGGAFIHTALQFIGPAVAVIGAGALAQDSTLTDSTLTAGSIVAIVIGALISLLLLAYSLSAYIGGVVDIANGALTTLGSFFVPRRYGSVLGATLVLVLAVGIGSLVFLVGGLIVMFLLWFTIPIIIDRGAGPVAAMKASASLVRANLGESLVTALLLGMVWVVGNSACGFFIIVTGPIVTLIALFALRRLALEQIAP